MWNARLLPDTFIKENTQMHSGISLLDPIRKLNQAFVVCINSLSSFFQFTNITYSDNKSQTVALSVYSSVEILGNSGRL